MKARRQSQFSRSPGFEYRKIEGKGRVSSGQAFALYCEDLPLTRIAERFGTPLYVYSEAMIRARAQAFAHAFSAVPHTVCYSVKANSNLGILRLLASLGCGFDIVSGGELERVLRVHPKAARKVAFSGVGKTPAELLEALRADILLFNVESESELHTLNECAAALHKVARIALRVNPDVSAKTHPYISTGLREHKFGVPISRAMELYKLAGESKHLQVAGVSVHIGSQITDMRPFSAAMTRVAELVRALRAERHKIRYVDAGGGLGICYDGQQDNFAKNVTRYARTVMEPLRKLNVHLLLEPGRGMVGATGALVTRVLVSKTNGRKTFVVVDAAMNDLVRPALYDAYHEIVPAIADDRKKWKKVDVVGPICETGDFLARNRTLPLVEEGDLLAVMDAGAYGMALASNYNSRPRPAEVLVRNGSVKVVRRRETLSQLLQSEI